MFSLANAGPAQHDTNPSKKRNRVMCRRCRHDKQGCHPPGRNWENGEKCDRCDRLGYDCSAPEKAPVKPRKRRSTLAAAVTNNPSPLHSVSYHFDAAEMHDSMISVTDQPPVRAQRPRPLSAFGAEAESHLPESSIPTHSQLESDIVVTSTRKSSEQEARTILARLGDLTATRVLLRSDLALCEQVETWLGPSLGVQKIRAALKAAISAIESEFIACWSNAKTYAPKDIGPKEAFLTQLSFVRYRFCLSSQPTNPDEGNGLQLMEQLDNDDVLDMLHDLYKRKRIWSAADYLFGNSSGGNPSRHSIHKNTEAVVAMCYIEASEGIKNIIASTVLEDADHRDILRGFSSGLSQASGSISGFPPCQLAVSQANSSVLLDLWKKSPMPFWDVDCLQRTPVHTAMYGGSIEALRRIFNEEPLTASNTGHDAFGMTPLAIAACKDDVKNFIKLVQAGANILEHTSPNIADTNSMGMSALALAARNGGEQVVRYILACPQIPFSFQAENAELCQALRSGHTRIAQILIDRHCNFDNYDLSDQLTMAKEIAEAKGFKDISTRLSKIMPVNASRYEAMDSLEELTFNQFINQDPTWDLQPHYDSSQISSQLSPQGFNWNSQETNGSSYSYAEPQRPSPHPALPMTGVRPTLTPSHIGGQHRHRGSDRMRPP